MHSALDVAAWFLNAIDRKAGDSITNLKLQKLVYYAQAWNVALLNQPLFSEPVEAWAHGPVVDAVYQEHKHAGFSALPASRKKPRFSAQELSILEDVMVIYGERSGTFLEGLTHQEAPWKDAWGDRPPSSRGREEISLDAMHEFYRQQYDNRDRPGMMVNLQLFRQQPLEDGVLPLPPRAAGDDWEPDAEFLAEADASARAIGRIRRARRSAQA